MINAVISLLATILPTLAPGYGRAEILFAGDAMQHKAQVEAARTSGGEYEYDSCFTELDSLIKAADYAVVNLETPLAGPPYNGYPNFSAPDSYALALKESGFDLFLTSNNHTLDCNDRGLISTIETLDSFGIPHTGTFRDPADRDTLAPFITTVNGFKIGFLNYTYGTNGIEPTGNVVVDTINRKQISADIRAAREKGAEIVCVAMHWGDEYILLPNAEQKSLAKFLKEEGADIIFGGHPHVIQPMELQYDSLAEKNIALFYSLGNYISNMKTRDTRGGALAKVVLERDSLGKANVASLSYKLIFTVPPQHGQKNYRLIDAETGDAGNWEAHRKSFVQKAEEIFSGHNRGIIPWE